MTARLSAYERETMIRTSDGDPDRCEVWSDQRRWVSRIRRLAKRFPAHVRVLVDEFNAHGQPSVHCIMPIEFLSLRGSRAGKFKKAPQDAFAATARLDPTEHATLA